MNMWISLVSNVVVGMLILATLTVVFVTVYRMILSTCGRKTAIVLALGTTLLSTIATWQIVASAVRVSPSSLLPAGGALVFAFLTLAVAELLAKLLVAAAGMVPLAKPEPTPRQEGDAVAQAEPHVEPANESVPPVKRRGRWSRQAPELPLQGHLDDLAKKPDPSKQQQGTGAESGQKQTASKSTV
jgi:hypothetical protein